MRHRGKLGLIGALLAIALLGQACVDAPGGGTTSGTVLYAYDNTAHKIIGWDATTFYDNDNPAVLKTVTSTVLTNKMGNLSWGGLCHDSSSDRLFLVNETTGDVVRVNRMRNQSGEIPSTTLDVVTFTLGTSSDRLPSGKFGQAAIDPATGTLYVTERNDSDTRIWVVAGAGVIIDKTVVQLTPLTVSGDKDCTGVAAGLGGQVIAYFNSGNAIGFDQVIGPRLRKGTSTGFTSDASVLIGTNTMLGKYGSLALDRANTMVFLARHNVDSSASVNPVQAYSTGHLSGTDYNQAPDFTLGTTADQGSLRVLAHPGNKEWLAALNSSGETPSNVIHIWKLPRDPKSVAKVKNITGVLFKGIALDGNY